MTNARNLLHPSSVIQIAAAAIEGQGRYGVVTGLAAEHGVRRAQVYDIRDRGVSALEREFCPSDPEPPGTFTWRGTFADVERAIIALRVVTPASIRDIVDILEHVLDIDWSYGKVWGVVNAAERRAAEHLRSVDLSGIKNVALDEMFSQGRPVLAGIDLDTQYLFQLQVNDSRSGEAWNEALGELRDQQSLSPTRVVKDAGTGLASGVGQAWPDAENQDDVFHASYRLGQEAYFLERRAYAAIASADALEAKRARARSETDRRRLGQELRYAQGRMDTAINQYDRFTVSHQKAERALTLSDRGSGQLRTSAEVTETITQVADEMDAIGGKRVRRLAKYLRNRAPGLGRYLDDLGARLAAAANELNEPVLVQAVTRAYQASLECHQGGPLWDRPARRDELRAATRHLLDTAAHDPERLQRAVRAVLPELANRYRASSAIENLNSVLRPYLVVQKHAQQGFLDLFRFYWNTRTRAWGRWKGTSAHAQLTGAPVDDWLALLGFPASDVRRKAA